jgi:hypothetical protein
MVILEQKERPSQILESVLFKRERGRGIARSKLSSLQVILLEAKTIFKLANPSRIEYESVHEYLR